MADDQDRLTTEGALAHLEHPAVTSAVTGPHTFGQRESRLGAGEVRLSRDVPERSDEIVPPGAGLSGRDAGHASAGLDGDASLDRRPA